MKNKQQTPTTAVHDVPVRELPLTAQQELVAEEVKRFIALSKQKGTLTIEEINELLSPRLSSQRHLMPSCMLWKPTV